MKIAFIGSGFMARAMIRGITESETLRGEDILVVNPADPAGRDEVCAEYGVTAAQGGDIASADCVFFAVKPQTFPEVCEQFGERLLTVYEGESQAEVILSALKAGPESESLSPLLPTGFAVLTVRTEGGICYLNLPKGDQYLMPEDETEQQRMVQGLVNSLCSARGVRQIQLLLDGEVASSLGSVDISQPFSPIR